jgi:hypothetical protein
MTMRRVAGNLAIMAAWLLIPSCFGLAQEPGVHYYHQGAIPPGAIGSRQLERGGPLPGYYQPVEIKAPNGARISLAVDGRFEEPRKGLRKAGLLIGSVYRLQVTGIPLAEGQEVFPTIEVIDRLFTPLGQEHRFSIPVELSDTDLKLALEGKFVTRVIYLEDPRDALPIRDDPRQQTWFEAAPGQDPLAIADSLGRPVAILRLGGRIPDANAGPDPQFFFGCPPFVDYPNPPPPVEKPLPAQSVKTTAKSAAKTVAKAGVKPVAEPSVKTDPQPEIQASPSFPRSGVVTQLEDAPASLSQTLNSKMVKTSFDAGASGNRVPTRERENEDLKASFKFEPKAPAPHAVKILPPPPNNDKTPAMSDQSAKEGPRS